MEGTEPGRGNLRAEASELLEEGQRLAKVGLQEKAIAAYRRVRAHSDDPDLWTRAWRLEAFAEQARGRWDEALAAARESQRIARELDRPDLLAEAMNAEAAVHYGRGEFDKALPLFEGMLALTDDPRIRGLAHQNMGIIHGRQGQPDLAEKRLLEAYDQFDRAGYDWGQAHVLNNRAAIALDQRAWGLAKGITGDAIAMARKVDDLDLLAVATLNLAEALAGLGELDRAEVQASTALGYFDTAGNRWRRISCYQILGDLHGARGEPDLARRFWTDGLELARELGAASEAAELEKRLSSRPP